MKVLIITYYWVPSGGSGVQRWLKFVKYLQNFNIQPIIYTVDNPKYAIVDKSLKKDVPDNIKVLRNSIFEPNNLFSFLGKKNTNTSAGFLNPNPSLFGKLLQYIRANYFVPDARKFWIRPSVTFLKKYLKNNKIDVIISTGPPHSLHLIGLRIKQELGIKWVADFRDPWTDIDYFHQLPLTKKTIDKHKKMEKKVLKTADKVLVVGKTMKQHFSKFSNNVHIITNGFDTKNLSKENISLDTRFTITHIGLMNSDRNPNNLWKVLANICKENINFANDYELKLVGKVSEDVLKSIKTNQLKNINLVGYVPHSKAQQLQQQSQVLLLAVNRVPSAKMIITGKVFEYLQAKRPILAIAPKNGDLAEIITQTQSGKTVGFNDENKLKLIILDWYKQYKKSKLTVSPVNIERYHRKNLTKKLANLLNELC